MKKRPLLVIAFLFILGLCLCHQSSMATSGEISVIDYPSIQEAIDANPGRMVHIPAGDYEIAKPIILNATGSGLFGYGRIIQTNPEAHILVISRTDDVRVSDLTLTRPEDKPGKRSALVAGHCLNLTLRGLQVIDTRAPAGAINIEYCDNTQIADCVVRNYATVSIEDRTGNENYGYAYKSIDGTGIQVSGTGILIQGNRVIQTELFPTPETQKEFQLGEFVNKNKKRGSLINEEAWEGGYTKNWNQGSSIHVGDPETSSHVQIVGNYIENGAQGVDIHGDQVTLANNMTNGAFLGMKAMHGSRNTLIVGNQFS
ncbi:MAG: hypothetical protein KC940_24085, partial [Candidatus Omnitrophica bacterium]|nr:hypothetical protein [Candidatus Omnitrophota bacterium]